MKNEDVLLLGGNGFIGSALARRLRQDGRPVHVLGRGQEEQLRGLLPQCGTVVHLACSTTPGASAASPSLELDNLALTSHLVDLLKAWPQTHLIFFSSGGTVYGNPQIVPVKEDSLIAPLSNHGASKASQEGLCAALRARSHAVTILRPSNAYGPGQMVKSGFGLVRTVLEHARHGTTLEIWGDGENVRDFIHVSDIAEACARLVSLPNDSGTYNVGSGKGHSVNQVLTMAEQFSERAVRKTYRPAREIDVRNVVLDTSLLQSRLSWAPQITLEEGMKETWEWLLNQP
jgi:UDP-glucose 4-epimerase